jgi:hypothetical protein
MFAQVRRARVYPRSRFRHHSNTRPAAPPPRHPRAPALHVTVTPALVCRRRVVSRVRPMHARSARAAGIRPRARRPAPPYACAPPPRLSRAASCTRRRVAAPTVVADAWSAAWVASLTPRLLLAYSSPALRLPRALVDGVFTVVVGGVPTDDDDDGPAGGCPDWPGDGGSAVSPRTWSTRTRRASFGQRTSCFRRRSPSRRRLQPSQL